MTPTPQTAWDRLAPWKQAQEWAKVDPEASRKILKGIDRKQRHLQRMEVLEHLAKLAPSACGLIAVIVTALLSKAFLDHDDPVQGAWIFGTSAVSLASVFVTQKLVTSRQHRLPPDANQQIDAGSPKP